MTSRPTQMTIFIDRLRHNYDVIREYLNPETEICAVVKAHGYGHGLVAMGRLYESLGVRYLAVALLEEGITLREAGIICPILVLGALAHEQVEQYIDYDLTAAGVSLDKLHLLNQAGQASGKQVKVHLNIDTGMGRIGIQWDRLQQLAAGLAAFPAILFEGLMTHCAQSESHDGEAYTRMQKKRFDQALSILSGYGFDFDLVHMANSGAVLRYPEMQYSMVRPGLLLYGIDPGEHRNQHALFKKPGLQLAHAWETYVSFFKVLEKGAHVSYGSRYRIDDTHERFVTLPVGYADGYTRALSGKARVHMNGESYPVVGTICMDQCVVSLGRHGEAHNGERVLLSGRDAQGNEIRPEAIAQAAASIPWEIITRISNRVPRVYVDGQSG